MLRSCLVAAVEARVARSALVEVTVALSVSSLLLICVMSVRSEALVTASELAAAAASAAALSAAA